METTDSFSIGGRVVVNNRFATIIEDLGLGLRRFQFSDHIEGELDLGIADITKLRPVPVTNSVSADMSENVFSGRLGEICQTRLNRFPIAYAWPALISAAGTMVPFASPVSGGISIGDAMTNFFTGLIGPVHSGKSQAIAWANFVIGLYPTMYSQVRAASSESLLKKLHSMHKKGELMKSLLVDLDEWQHLFSKANIEHSSFTSFLQSAFYRRAHNVIIGGGFDIELTCALTFIGGIVQDEFEECFGARSMGGLHDRFMFGLCPEGFNFLYRPFEGAPETINPISVRIDRDVWEMIDALRKSNTSIGREAEIAARVAHVCASFDGRPVLHAKDCEKSVEAFIAEQIKIRDFLKPNDGLTNDAKCANALLDWLRRNASVMEIVPERKLRNGLRRTLSRLGPGALSYATANLARQGILAYGDIADAKPYNGRKPKGYQLLSES
jgi:hypothetical protein